MIRVLHIMGCSDAGGISSVVLNYYRHMDRTKVHFDIALTVPSVGQNALALQELGAQIHFLPLKSEGLSVFRQALEELLRKGEYDAIHVHENETSYVALAVAKKMGIRCRLAHSHTSSPYENIKSEIRRLSGCILNYHYATRVIGCGQLAGERVFGKWNMKRPKAVVLPNAIDTRKFAFDPDLRDEVRGELGLEGKYVLGMVGRLCEEKNYPFALELMAKLRQERPECMLVIAGNGEYQELIEEKIRELNLEDNVMLLGRRSDVHRLYQAFDVFLLPSFHEGFPVAAVEAMASGLPVLFSERITKELSFGSGAVYLPLAEPDAWLVRLREGKENDPERSIRQEEPRRNGLDIRDTAAMMETLYRRDLNQ